MTPTIKPVWTDADLDVMSFHDVHVRAFCAAPESYELLMDLDYLFQWVAPPEGETYFRFWVAPVTLVFANVYDVRLDLQSSQGDIEIFSLHRGEGKLTPNGQLTEHRYQFDCQEGELSLSATGFHMYVRSPPVLVRKQSLTLRERGGIGFGRAWVEPG
jgi:hypothetical protein